MGSEKYLNEFLEDLVQKLNMKKIPEGTTLNQNPHSFVFSPRDVPHTEYGVTGSIMMYESHCAAHTWSYLGQLSITICSCKPFCTNSILDWITTYVGSSFYDFQVIKL